MSRMSADRYNTDVWREMARQGVTVRELQKRLGLKDESVYGTVRRGIRQKKVAIQYAKALNCDYRDILELGREEADNTNIMDDSYYCPVALACLLRFLTDEREYRRFMKLQRFEDQNGATHAGRKS